jgi:integrase/recombinase XerD
MSTAAVWKIVTRYCEALGFANTAPHDLRRTAAKLMRAGGASLEQISLTLGHESLDVTKRYLGTELDLTDAATDAIDLR